MTDASLGLGSLTAQRSPWLRFALVRVGGSVVGAVAIVVATFFLVLLLPGDPAVVAAGAEASSQEIDRARNDLGLDAPIWARLGALMVGLLSGDLGTSFATGQPVSAMIGSRLGITVGIAVVSAALTLIVAIGLGAAVGMLTANDEHRRLGTVLGWVTGVASTVPGYLVAAGLVVIFALWLGVLPPSFSARHAAASLVLPIAALTLAPVCSLARVTRRETLAVMGQEHVRMARSWGVSAPRLVTRYVLPQVSASALALGGALLSGLIGGSVIVENVFAVPGMGTALVTAITQRDYPTVQGITIVLGMLSAGIVLVVDVVLAMIDPRRLRSDVTT